jgi:site-specific recombinase XerD
MVVSSEEVRWDLYPHVATDHQARTFIQWLVLNARRPKTIDAYARAIDHFLKTFPEPERLIEVNEADLLSYLASLKQRVPHRRKYAFPSDIPDNVSSPVQATLSDATIAQHIVALRLFYDFLIRRQFRSDQINPLPRGSLGLYGTSPKRGLVPLLHHVPWITSESEWKRVVLHVVAQTNARNRALLILTYDTALRREEVMSLREDDIDWSRALVHVRAETSNSGRSRSVPFSGFTERVLKQYITTDRYLLVATYHAEEHGPLFLSESTQNPGKPLAPGALNDIIEELRVCLNLPQLTPHTLRHHRLTTLKRAGVALDDIALFAGHKDIETTRLYLHIAPVELAREVRSRTKSFDTFMEQLIQEHVQ